MKKVSKINCENRAGFVQEFKVVWNGGASGWSGRYPNPQTESIDLHTLNIPAGDEVWIDVYSGRYPFTNSGDTRSLRR